MKVTHVAIRATDSASEAGRPTLTPELLAASGARYSRNNEGLSTILGRIDPNNLDASVDSIFRMIDYGHQSIADMVPVALFIDGVSIWLAYYVWTLCPTAGGQESSTRYIRMSAESLVDPALLSIPPSLHTEWHSAMEEAFQAYKEAIRFWEEVSQDEPAVMRVPPSLLQDPSDSSQKKVARLRRNYAFDRARYFLPVAAATNLMLLMSARGWVSLCQHLLSHPIEEARALGEKVREELRLAAPRMLKHAEAKTSIQRGIIQQYDRWTRHCCETDAPALSSDDGETDAVPRPILEISLPPDLQEAAMSYDLTFHDNRYAWIGDNLRRTAVRFGWSAVAFAEIRDLNRHRTGNKYCPLVPQGFYYAADQVPASQQASHTLSRLAQCGRKLSRRSRELLSEGDPSSIFWTVLGTQFPFEHLTTADKFLYEVELRTGLGAHYRYADHLQDTLALWYQRFPHTRGLVLEGSAEPE